MPTLPDSNLVFSASSTFVGGPDRCSTVSSFPGDLFSAPVSATSSIKTVGPWPDIDTGSINRGNKAYELIPTKSLRSLRGYDSETNDYFIVHTGEW